MYGRIGDATDDHRVRSPLETAWLRRATAPSRGIISQPGCGIRSCRPLNTHAKWAGPLAPPGIRRVAYLRQALVFTIPYIGMIADKSGSIFFLPCRCGCGRVLLHLPLDGTVGKARHGESNSGPRREGQHAATVYQDGRASEPDENRRNGGPQSPDVGENTTVAERVVPWFGCHSVDRPAVCSPFSGVSRV